MKVEVRFFARCREIVGVEQKELVVEEDVRIKDIVDLIIKKHQDLNLASRRWKLYIEKVHWRLEIASLLFW